MVNSVLMKCDFELKCLLNIEVCCKELLQIKYCITGNFCGVKFLRFWSKKMTFNFCGFLFLRIENLGTEKKFVCITRSNN